MMESRCEKDVDSYKTTGVAARLGDLVGLQHLVWNGRPIDVVDNRGWSPLHEAADGGFSGCLEFLLRQPGTDPDCKSHRDETPILLAARQGHHQCLRALINFQADINAADNLGFTPLYEAIRARSNDCIRQLVKKGAEKNHACYTGFTPLHEAANIGSATITSYLLQQGAYQNVVCNHGLTPLFVAVQSGSEETVHELLEHLNVVDNKEEDVVNMAACDNATPLLMAAQEGHADIIEMLLEHGADPNIQVTETKAGPLQYAVHGGHVKCVRKLVPVTDLKLFDNDFGSMHPLVQALKFENTDILKQLLAAGIDHRGVHPLEEDDFEHLRACSGGLLERGCRASLLCHITKDMPVSGARFLLQGGLPPNVRHLNGVMELPPIVAAMLQENYPLFCLLLHHRANPNVYSSLGNVSMLSALHCDFQRSLEVEDMGGRVGSNNREDGSDCDATDEEDCGWWDRGSHSFFLSLFAAGGEVETLLQNAFISSGFGLVGVLTQNLLQSGAGLQEAMELQQQRNKAQVTGVLALLLCLSTNMVSPPKKLLDLISADQADSLTRLSEKNQCLAQLCRLHIFRCLQAKEGKLQDKIASLGLPKPVANYLSYPELAVHSQTLVALLKSKQ